MPVIEAPQSEESNRLTAQCLRILGAVLAVKILFFLLDPAPSFSFDDSGAYLATAIIHYIPLDRSFLYGMLLKPAVRIQTLEPIVAAQVLMSTVSAALAGFALLRYFRTNMRVAMGLSVLCAVEPLQLSMERFIMTDAVATFGFVCFLCAGLEYIHSAKLWWLAAAEVVGAFLVAIRISYLPIVLVATVLFPLLPYFRRGAEFPKSAFRITAVALLFSVCFSQLLLLGYRHWYGSLVGKAPAYNYREGDFLLGDFAPVVQPEDFPDRAQGEAIFSRVKFPLKDPEMRAIQRWMAGGIVDSLTVVIADEDTANAVAKKAVQHAVFRNPLAALRLVAGTYEQFLRPSLLKDRIRWEEEQVNPPSPGSQKLIARVFGIDTRKVPPPSLAKRYAVATAGWATFLVTFPFLYAILLVIKYRRLQAAHLVIALFALMIVAGSVATTEAANPRYLTGLAWLTFLMFGSLISLWSRRVPD